MRCTHVGNLTFPSVSEVRQSCERQYRHMTHNDEPTPIDTEYGRFIPYTGDIETDRSEDATRNQTSPLLDATHIEALRTGPLGEDSLSSELAAAQSECQEPPESDSTDGIQGMRMIQKDVRVRNDQLDFCRSEDLQLGQTLRNALNEAMKGKRTIPTGTGRRRGLDLTPNSFNIRMAHEIFVQQSGLNLSKFVEQVLEERMLAG